MLLLGPGTTGRGGDRGQDAVGRDASSAIAAVDVSAHVVQLFGFLFQREIHEVAHGQEPDHAAAYHHAHKIATQRYQGLKSEPDVQPELNHA